MMPPAMRSDARRECSCFFHHGRVSLTSYAMFNASISDAEDVRARPTGEQHADGHDAGVAARGHDLTEDAAQERQRVGRHRGRQPAEHRLHELLAVPDEAEQRSEEEQQREEREEEVVRRLGRDRRDAILTDLLDRLLEERDDVVALDGHDTGRCLGDRSTGDRARHGPSATRRLHLDLADHRLGTHAQLVGGGVPVTASTSRRRASRAPRDRSRRRRA